MKFTGIKSAELQSKAIQDVNHFIVRLLSQNKRKLYKISDNQFKTKYGLRFLKWRLFKRYFQKKQIKGITPQINFAEVTEIDIVSDVFITAKIRVKYIGEEESKYIYVNFNATKRAYLTDAKEMFRYNPLSIRLKKNVA